MVRRIRRRSVLQGTVGAAAAVAGSAVLGAEAAAAPNPRMTSGVVVRVSGVVVEVELTGGGTASVPAVGFPDGWQLRPGDVVAVANADSDGSPDHAQPLITPVTGAFRAGPGSEALVGGQPVRVVRQTVREPAAAARGSHAVALCMENRRERVLTAAALRFGA